MTEINLSRIMNAYQVIREKQLFTPLREYPKASKYLNVKLLVKHEDYNLSGSFKIRNAIAYFQNNLSNIKKKVPPHLVWVKKKRLA